MTTKLLAAAALALSLSFSTVAFAGNPKTDAKKDAKTEVNTYPKSEGESQVEAKTISMTLHVTGTTTIDGKPAYFVEENSTESCDGGSSPCEVVSSEAPDAQGRIKQEDVTSVLTYQPQL